MSTSPTSGIFNRPVGLPDSNYNVNTYSFGYCAFQGIYDDNNNLIYKGQAKPGTSTTAAAWQIAQLNYDDNNNLISILWPQTAEGNASNDFIFVFADYSDYTYS